VKNKILLISTITFFILVNTSYYWEAILGTWSILMTLFLFVIFLTLIISLIYQLILSFKEKFKFKARVMLVALMAVVLTLTYFNPSGFIDFEKLEGEDLLVASREGAANCMTIIKFKSNYTFQDRSVCFGIDVIRGKYSIKNDTIKFEKVNREKKYYQFAVIRPTISKNNVTTKDLVLYKDINDTLPLTLFISTNKLIK
jgi:hypothetical protein